MYSPSTPKKNNVTPKKKKIDTISIEIPGKASFGRNSATKKSKLRKLQMQMRLSYQQISKFSLENLKMKLIH